MLGSESFNCSRKGHSPDSRGLCWFTPTGRGWGPASCAQSGTSIAHIRELHCPVREMRSAFKIKQKEIQTKCLKLSTWGEGEGERERPRIFIMNCPSAIYMRTRLKLGGSRYSNIINYLHLLVLSYDAVRITWSGKLPSP